MRSEEELPEGAQLTTKTPEDVPIHTNVMVGIEELIPHVDFSGLPNLELDGENWATLEEALNRPLSDELRRDTIFAVMYFAHSVALKDEIKTPRQYQNDMEERVDAIIATAEDLLQMVVPTAPPPEGTNQGSRADKLKILKPGLRTNSNAAVLDVNDHIRLWLLAKHPDLRSTIGSITNTLRALAKLKSKIADARGQEASAGNPEQTELKILFRRLLQTARDAGDGLDLPGHEIRDTVMGVTTPRHPAYDFVMAVTALLLAGAQELVDQAIPDFVARQHALARFHKYLDKGSGKHIDFLEEARAHIEGGPRSRKPIG